MNTNELASTVFGDTCTCCSHLYMKKKKYYKAWICFSYSQNNLWPRFFHQVGKSNLYIYLSYKIMMFYTLHINVIIFFCIFISLQLIGFHLISGAATTTTTLDHSILFFFHLNCCDYIHLLGTWDMFHYPPSPIYCTYVVKHNWN